MFQAQASPRSLYALFMGIALVHVCALLFQTFSEDIAHSLSQSTSGLRVYFEQAQVQSFPKKKIPKPVIKELKNQATTSQTFTAPQVASSTTAPSAASQDLKLVYLGELRQLIESKKVYPLQAKRLGQTGTVEVTFTLSGDGHIMDAHVTQGSPYERLNQAALATVMEVRHFRPIPPEIGEDSMTVKIPMRYSLYQ
jgi:protein TonB